MSDMIWQGFWIGFASVILGPLAIGLICMAVEFLVDIATSILSFLAAVVIVVFCYPVVLVRCLTSIRKTKS